MPLPGAGLRTIARPRTSPFGKSNINSIVEPSLGGFAACRYRPPRPIIPAHEVLVWPADFQPTNIPLGARTRGYFRWIAGSGAMLKAYRQPCINSIRCEPERRHFGRRSASMSNGRNAGIRASGDYDRRVEAHRLLLPESRLM